LNQHQGSVVYCMFHTVGYSCCMLSVSPSRLNSPIPRRLRSMRNALNSSSQPWSGEASGGVWEGCGDPNDDPGEAARDQRIGRWRIKCAQSVRRSLRCTASPVPTGCDGAVVANRPQVPRNRRETRPDVWLVHQLDSQQEGERRMIIVRSFREQWKRYLQCHLRRSVTTRVR
jgi:hypothetical protein